MQVLHVAHLTNFPTPNLYSTCKTLSFWPTQDNSWPSQQSTHYCAHIQKDYRQTAYEVMARWRDGDWLSPMEHPHHPLPLGLPLLFKSGDLRCRFLPLTDRTRVLFIHAYTMHTWCQDCMLVTESDCGLYLALVDYSAHRTETDMDY